MHEKQPSLTPPPPQPPAPAPLLFAPTEEKRKRVGGWVGKMTNAQKVNLDVCRLFTYTNNIVPVDLFF